MSKNGYSLIYYLLADYSGMPDFSSYSVVRGPMANVTNKHTVLSKSIM
jgi:hypothetical protein